MNTVQNILMIILNQLKYNTLTMGNWFKKEEIKQQRRTKKNLKEQLKSPDNKKQAESTSNRNNVNNDT